MVPCTVPCTLQCIIPAVYGPSHVGAVAMPIHAGALAPGHPSGQAWEEKNTRAVLVVGSKCRKSQAQLSKRRRRA
jgi:hypothetical protein